MAKVKIIRPMLTVTGPEGVEFKKLHGTAARRASYYEDELQIFVLLFVSPLFIALAVPSIMQIDAIPKDIRTALGYIGILIMSAEFLFSFIDCVRYTKALRDFYRSAMERGGETVDEASEKVVEHFKDWGVRLAIIAGVCLIVAFATSIAAIFINPAGNADSFLAYMNPFCLTTVMWNLRNANTMYSAVIFLGLDEGVIIGQTLFPYTVLGDLRETGPDRYELWHGGKAVMRGTLPKETADALRETAAVVTKYASHLNAGAEQIPVSSPKAWRPYGV
jgi:hypothetical protein